MAIIYHGSYPFTVIIYKSDSPYNAVEKDM